MTRKINTQPEQTNDGKIYSGRQLIADLRKSETAYSEAVFLLDVKSLDATGETVLVTCQMVLDNRVVATSAVTRSKSDKGPDNDKLGSNHCQAAVTIAKKECIMDFFGLQDEYNEKPVLSNEIQAGIENLLKEKK